MPSCGATRPSSPRHRPTSRPCSRPTRSSPRTKSVAAASAGESREGRRTWEQGPSQLATPKEGEEEQDDEGGDSDEETDQLLFTLEPPVVDTDDDELSYRQVTLDSTAYTTYRAALVWMLSSHVAFAPLKSVCNLAEPPAWLAQETPNTQARVTRQEILQRAHDKSPSLPLPVSPKSLFRLAHFLEILELQEVALACLESQITVENCAVELFSEVSILYPEVSSVLLESASANWAAVNVSSGMKEAERKVENDEVPGAARIFVKLMSRVSG